VGSAATGDYAAAFGQASFANGNSSTAIGRSAVASSDFSTAVGQGATATGREASAFGQGATASGSGSLALGQAALASGANTVAVGGGQGASAVADNSIAIGQGAQALATNSVAIGTGTIADQPNTVSLGGRRLVNVAPGIASSDAATFGQVNAVQRRAYGGIAVAVAMGGTSIPADKTYAVSTNYGTYRGESGFAGGLAVRVADYATLNGSIGIGVGHGDVGGRIGAMIAW
jgi:hypothetical protein